jgi:3-hydroxy-5-phosphonooxypentane-2,4-dione thiolase
MDWGMKNRISKIIRPEDGRTVMLAIDHGYFLGPTQKLENPGKIIKPLLPYADSLMLTRGILRTSLNPSVNIPIVLRVSGGSSVIGEDLSNECLTTSVEDALKLNVSCVALSIFVGSKYEHRTLKNLAKLVDECERFGIPALAVTAVGKEMTRDYRYLALSCRIAAELGAHIVKTYYCENFDKIVEGCPVPIVVAGGKKSPEPEDALRLAYEAVEHGAAGVDMGRNIWQSEFPVAMIKAIRSIVHGNSTVKEASEIFIQEKDTIQNTVKTA